MGTTKFGIVTALGCIPGLLLAALAPGLVHAQRADGAFPSRPVRVIVPLAPGGGSDIVARITAAALGETWGQTVVVDNRPGAGSVVGTAIAAKAQPDGHTLLVSSSSLAISPALYRNLPYDIRRDLLPVTLVASQPSLLAVHSSVPAATVKELLALGRAQPGKLAYGSAGAGSATHLGSELFRIAGGIELLHLPYKSAGLATNALLSGEVQVLITNMASLLPHLKGGKVRALGVTSLKRSALAPEIPTVSEAGLPKFEYLTWYGMMAPAGTPKAVVDAIQRDTARSLRVQSWSERFTQQGLDVFATTPSEFGQFLASELSRWDAVVRKAGIKVD
ncbi:MAG: tripartite tricarboxylate transporter substrate binding protein [Burkholderiales bacterium]|nr:tripartite tricarboxylate transporter substrate binding protein [Burkholderiales bacterium]